MYVGGVIGLAVLLNSDLLTLPDESINTVLLPFCAFSYSDASSS
jgi:hypothetical protein